MASIKINYLTINHNGIKELKNKHNLYFKGILVKYYL